jgi:4'-phosphopantetheinyl transferase
MLRTVAADGTVEIWRSWLDRSPTSGDDLLSEDERARAASFVFSRDRARYIASRCFLRRVLSHYVERPASAIRFSYSSLGKPELALPHDATLHFNLAHAAGLAVVAISRTGTVGVDVEELRTIADAERLATQFFSPDEREFLKAAPEAIRSRTFLSLWTCKEAYLKGIGGGLSLPLDCFSVTSDERLDSWLLASFTPAPDFVGAIAAAHELTAVNYVDDGAM